MKPKSGMLLFPGGVRRDPAIDAWLSEQSEALGSLAQRWFEAMRECGDDVVELMHDGCPTACVENAPFVYVGVFRGHVNVGFFYGAELEDPAGLLQGTGKRMRHAKLRPGASVDSAALGSLIDAAYSDIRARLGVSMIHAG